MPVRTSESIKPYQLTNKIPVNRKCERPGCKIRALQYSEQLLKTTFENMNNIRVLFRRAGLQSRRDSCLNETPGNVDAIIYLKYCSMQRWVSVINHILPRVEFCRLCRRLRVSAHSLLPQIALSCITPVKPPPVNTRLIYNVVLRDRCLFAEYSRRIYHALRINFLRPRKCTPMRKTDYVHRARRNFRSKSLSTDVTECNLFRAIDTSPL